MRSASLVTKREDLNQSSSSSALHRSSSSSSSSAAMLVPLVTWPPKAEHVLYRGEGNSSLVVALPHDNHVIRLLKCPKDQKEDKEDDHQDNDEDTELEIPFALKAHLLFSERVVSQLMARAFFHVPQLVRLSRDFLLELRKLVSDKRPLYRRQKAISSSRFALLLPDYCSLPQTVQESRDLSGPLIAIEIKPKQGFLPSSSLLNEELKIKSHVCRYGLSQFHKLKKGSIHSRSRYCPLDLFSGCHARQTRALHALLDSPQNNLRVFRDFRLAFGDQSNRTLDDVIRDVFPLSQSAEARKELFCSLVVQTLNKRFTHCPPLSPPPPPLHQTCALHSNACTCQTQHVLDEGCVLSAVLSAQRLDSIDSRLANEMWAWLQQHTNNNEGEGLSLQLNGGWLPRFWAREERHEEETEVEYCLRKVWQFLVSLTAKDCSLMIAIQRVLTTDDRADDEHVLVIDNVSYWSAVHVTDLDRKPSEKVNKTLQNDLRMIRAMAPSSRVNCLF